MSEDIKCDGRTAEVRDPMIGNQPEDRCRLYLAKADLRPAGGDDGPWIGPTGAMEHRQCPEIDAVESESEAEAVAERREVGATMAVDDAFRITGGSGGIEQAKRLPLIRDSWPMKPWVGGGEESFIIVPAKRCSRGIG